MKGHPSPKQLAAYLRHLADKLDTNGGRALEMAAVLASRGYPTSTGGNGARSADQTTSTERAALHGAPKNPGDPWRPGEWEDADHRLAANLKALHTAALTAESGIDTVLHHGTTTSDQLPGGTGYCTCGGDCALDRKGPTFCAPRQNGSSDRLKVGLAPNCYKRFLRWQDSHPGGTAVDWKHATRRAREVADERAAQLAAGRAGLRG